MLRLDHVFSFVDPEQREAAALEAEGFEVRPGRDHRGQGTSNRNLPFGDIFVELIHLRDRKEAENNPLRLDRRADWRELNTCPFGIALRGHLPEGIPAWTYTPSYPIPFTIRVVHGPETRPLIFAIEPSAPDSRPHTLGPTLRDLLVEGPGLAHFDLASLEQRVGYRSAPRWRLSARRSPKLPDPRLVGELVHLS